jgi:hypothetical protein
LGEACARTNRSATNTSEEDGEDDAERVEGEEEVAGAHFQAREIEHDARECLTGWVVRAPVLFERAPPESGGAQVRARAFGWCRGRT